MLSRCSVKDILLIICVSFMSIRIHTLMKCRGCYLNDYKLNVLTVENTHGTSEFLSCNFITPGQFIYYYTELAKNGIT